MYLFIKGFEYIEEDYKDPYIWSQVGIPDISHKLYHSLLVLFWSIHLCNRKYDPQWACKGAPLFG